MKSIFCFFLPASFYKIVATAISFYYITSASAFNKNNLNDTTPMSTQKEAILFIENIKDLKSSAYWPNVNPNLFLRNLKENIYTPLSIYEGSNTNFCGYAALSYLPLHDDPLGYAKFMLQLYEQGKAKIGTAFIQPSSEILQAAGTLKYKGVLDIRPADQVWFLSLADHFKGYVNFFNRHYDAGDENTFWASVNYAKFNRMVRKLFNYTVNTRGYDLIHPHINDLYEYISNKMKEGTVVLYLNNAYLYKKKHNTVRPAIPTHFIILLDIIKTGDFITIIYWDYGFRSLRQITPAFLKKIVFGISCCTKKLSHE
ncbi:MAG: hypothetical protein JWN83_1481 [Chitinophagaceae bacterium]|nr:hypothetical protein [Chitinophagaceae bacterium]